MVATIVVAVTAREVVDVVTEAPAREVVGETEVTVVAVLEAVLDDVVLVEVVVTPPGGGFQPRIVVPAHSLVSTLLSRPHSL